MTDSRSSVAVQDEVGAAIIDVPAMAQSVETDYLIHDELVYTGLLLDADGDINHSVRRLVGEAKNVLQFHYQRVACSSDTCRQEFVTYSAVQYPKDSLLQVWMADVLSDFYYDATRRIDLWVNGERFEDNGEGEVVLRNVGCHPYQGVLADQGKSLFDYYQSRMWVIGKNRGDQHGPSGRYGCVIYRCWQSSDYVSYFVAYSTDEPQWPVHGVYTFDRRTGQMLDMTDIVRPENEAEFLDLVADAAHGRHTSLRRRNTNDLAIDNGTCDYSSMIDIKSVGFTAEGIAVSTSALAFDQWATSTHILIIPYTKVKGLLFDTIFR